MAGFQINGAQYAIFQAIGGDIHQLAYGAGGDWNWVETNISAAAKAPEGDGFLNGVAAFAVPGTPQIEVYYAAANTGRVYQLTFADNKWKNKPLPGQAPLAGSSITAFATTPNNQFHVYFSGDAKKPGIFQDYFNGSVWSNARLINDAPYSGSATSGFARGNLQYVYYFSME